MESHNDHRYIQQIFFERIRDISQSHHHPQRSVVTASPAGGRDGDDRQGLFTSFPLAPAAAMLPWPPTHSHSRPVETSTYRTTNAANRSGRYCDVIFADGRWQVSPLPAAPLVHILAQCGVDYI